jgi:retron-type reverse transcriptase
MPRTFISKPNKLGKYRPITKHNPKDIVVLDAFLIMLNKWFQSIFVDFSHRFRQKRGVRTSLFTIGGWGKVNHFLSTDVVRCLENMDHCLLLNFVQDFIPDKRLGDLIMNFVKVDILDKEGNNYAGLSKGIPQGCSISPVLMNIYMHPFDVKLSTFLSSYGHIHYLRYANDMLIGVGELGNLKDDRIQE